MKELTSEFIHKMRQCVRISHDRHDEEIADLILAAQADLEREGIIPEKARSESDPLIKRAVSCYVKAEFGLDNADSEKYRASYETLRKHLALSNDYTRKAEGA